MVRLACVAVAVCAVSLSGTGAPAAAQGWFGGFFGGQPQTPYGDPPYPGYGQGPRAHSVPRRRTPRTKHPVDQTREDDQPTPPKNATVFVDVFGDTLGQLLANGLDDALADRAEVGVVHLARGPSGLANESYYDWPKTIEGLLARAGPAKKGGAPTPDAHPTGADDKAKDKSERIDVAVMMIGSNDRQQIIKDGEKLRPGSDEWNAIYKERVMAIAEAFQKKKIPLVWVGVPIVKDDDFADDMAALNEIYKEAAARTGAAYIDTWEAFGDDDGDFSAYGPDINGQTVRLRTADGIYFTKAGARKLAHFVEGQVRRDLDGKTPLPELPTAEAPPTDKAAKGAAIPVKPEAGPIKNLDEPPVAKDGHLAEAPPVTARAGSGIAEARVKGRFDPPPAARADNFSWPPEPAPAH